LGEKPLSPLPQDAKVVYETMLVLSAGKIKLKKPPPKTQTPTTPLRHSEKFYVALQ